MFVRPSARWANERSVSNEWAAVSECVCLVTCLAWVRYVLFSEAIEIEYFMVHPSTRFVSASDPHRIRTCI